ncbi:zinc finger protein 91 isoform X1 [Zeugodacus cucurbitae]|nr:zinc finger protein 91 isoform X1 [Zeugodacus cucurbitae]
MADSQLSADLPANQGTRSNHKAGRFICHTCNKRFTKQSILCRHEVVHLQDKPFECLECHKRFSQNSSLRRHCLEQHDSNLKRFQCAKCPLSFAQKSNLSLHDKKVHPPNISAQTASYACDHCGSVYRNKQKLSRHKNLVHKDKTKTKIAYDEIDEEDDLALTQSVLEQLKTFQMEMHALEAPVLETEGDLVTSNINVSNKHIDFKERPTQQQAEKRINDGVQLKDSLNAEGIACYLSVQRTVGKNGYAVYTCEYCVKEFRKSYDYIRHRRVHTRERPYNCTLCERTFSIKSKLHDHMRIHRLDEQQGILAKHYPCAVCCQAFSSLRLLDKHISTHAPIYKIAYKCKTCEELFKTSTALAYHKHKQIDADAEFLQQLLPAPAEIYTNASNTETDCDLPVSASVECIPAATKSVQHLKRSRVVPKWQCIACERHFSSSTNLRHHRRIYHSAYKRKRRISASAVIRCYKCSYCTRVFQNKTRCKAHMLTHLKRLLNTHEYEQSPHTKNIINALAFVTGTTNTASVKVVEFKVITKYRKFATNVCDKNQKCSKNATLYHKCQICSCQFRKQSDLKRHLLVHTGERLHKCSTCNKSFSLRSTLQQHMLTHATERTKHICIVCAKTYLTKKALNVHLRLHTGAQPFQCVHCAQKFRTSGQRIAHLKVKHGISKS